MEIRSFPDQARKRKKESEPTTDDFYKIGKELQNRSGQNLAANASENRRFREFFGTGANVALIAWQLLVYYDLVPESGLILHMLWGMFFMKVYPKQGPGSAAAGGSNGAIDVKTWRKYLWPFIGAIAELEPYVVSDFAVIV